MKEVGFPITEKENENRRALVPSDISNIKNNHFLYFEKGYGEVLGYSDSDYIAYGAQIGNRKEILSKDIICDPKIGDEQFLSNLKSGQTVFGWIHAVQNKDITDKIVNNQLTAYAWEDMFDEGRHVFWHNNEMAGEAAVMHAFQCYGQMPYDTNVALLGKGNVARGALRILNCLGAKVTVYDRRTEKLFCKEMSEYDVIINALLWDTKRKDHIIYKDDLKKLKHPSLIIDISCDRNGAIESSVPTTIDKPIYTVDGVVHYVVDHTPSLFFKTASLGISLQVSKYLDDLIEEKHNAVLQNSLIIKNGVILDDRIIRYQRRNKFNEWKG